MTPEEIAEVLEQAAHLLETKGWIQDELEDEGGFCALGAITKVLRTQNPRMEMSTNALYRGPAVRALADHVGCSDRLNVDVTVTTWNDDGDRTKQEVLDAFHSAAKKALGVVE